MKVAFNVEYVPKVFYVDPIDRKAYQMDAHNDRAVYDSLLSEDWEHRWENQKIQIDMPEGPVSSFELYSHYIYHDLNEFYHDFFAYYWQGLLRNWIGLQLGEDNEFRSFFVCITQLTSTILLLLWHGGKRSLCPPAKGKAKTKSD